MSEACPRCGAPPSSARLGICPRCLFEAELPPALIGGTLAIEEEIGRGGMGAVYRARDVRLGRTVAVKFLPARLAAQPEFRKRFEREARALAMLNHPNIVAVYDVGQDDDQSYIVMEYVDGPPLAAQVPLPWKRAVEVALQVCDALAHAHGQGIVHRDIKPENILIDAAGRAKVADFGIARLMGPDAAAWMLTAPDHTAGTPHYLAPETLAGAPPDPRMDVYSVGVVLYQIITGRLPVGNFDPLATPLDRIVRRALAPDPKRRYASADEMRRALAATLRLPAADQLPPDERTWIYAVALLQAFSTAVALWAFLLSVTPKVIRPDDVLPLIMLGPEHLPDGRILSRARFETGPTLAAIATFAIAISGYGLLRLHWRRTGLEHPDPERPIHESRWVLIAGVVACCVYAIGKLLEPHHLVVSNYIPILGGVIETVALFFLWVSILQAWRIARPLRRETAMWVGFGLVLLAPIVELLVYVRNWRP
jgi:eukaryotic-like serine/threonine-protein kinase